MTHEITIYQQGDKLYCEDCKPRGGKRGTLVTSSYDHYCSGCGEAFLEMAEDAASLQDLLAQPTLGPFTFEELTQLLTHP
jgi:hypothetical protein